MDYSKENIILEFSQLQDRLFQRKYHISNHDVLYLSLRPLDRQQPFPSISSIIDTILVLAQFEF